MCKIVYLMLWLAAPIPALAADGTSELMVTGAVVEVSSNRIVITSDGHTSGKAGERFDLALTPETRVFTLNEAVDASAIRVGAETSVRYHAAGRQRVASEIRMVRGFAAPGRPAGGYASQPRSYGAAPSATFCRARIEGGSPTSAPRAAEPDPKRALDRAMRLFDQRQFREAVPYFTRVVEAEPRNDPAWFFRGIARKLSRAPDIASSDNDITCARMLNPAKARTYTNMAADYLAGRLVSPEGMQADWERNQLRYRCGLYVAEDAKAACLRGDSSAAMMLELEHRR